jgi:hypothetical protein
MKRVKSIAGGFLLLSLLFVSGCARFAADASRAATFQPVQISAPEFDAAEPVTVSAPNGGFYVLSRAFRRVFNRRRQNFLAIVGDGERMHSMCADEQVEVAGLPCFWSITINGCKWNVESSMVRGG